MTRLQFSILHTSTKIPPRRRGRVDSGEAFAKDRFPRNLSRIPLTKFPEIREPAYVPRGTRYCASGVPSKKVRREVYKRKRREERSRPLRECVRSSLHSPLRRRVTQPRAKIRTGIAAITGRPRETGISIIRGHLNTAVLKNNRGGRGGGE